MIVHLIDGTYELFRHFFGARRGNKGEDLPFAAVTGVLNTVLQMYETGGTHVGVATDRVIESFRNKLWPGYKTGYGIEKALFAQFRPLEDALEAMGVPVWPMVELEADDALASATFIARQDPRVEKVCIWTSDKDLTQCVIGDRVVQVDRKSGHIRNAEGVKAKFGVPPESIPDYLALVGDSADGFPGIAGFGPRTAADLLNKYKHIDNVPSDVTGNAAKRLLDEMDLALLFRTLATLRTDAPLFDNVDELRWNGPTSTFEAWTVKMNAPRVLERALRAAEKL